MPDCTMDGRVVIVTGAGRGIGRAHAMLLAERGAAVLVNDLGTDANGLGADSGPAQETADAIVALGGRAVANTDDVASEAGGQAMVDAALSAFGRIDAVVNNAGIVGVKGFAETSIADFEHYWRIHFVGHYAVTRAAWPHFVRQGYGRVVMTTSASGLYGLKDQTPYAAAKGAIQGFTRALAHEGADHGILVNAIAPGGFSRMHMASELNEATLQWGRKMMPPELVAPAALWLASEACTVNGEMFSVWSGRVARVHIGTAEGYFDRDLTAEKILENYSQVAVMDNFHAPHNALEEVSHWMATEFAR
ncbi:MULTISPECIES: SDR family NAD(P)-dependent oxidoreductase [Sphingobium]|uniref:SDR family NAD(P)-dependent oxidoreductase n=1 Tax=Sphingobium sp. MI1205 TaxID=407020 RepID=UPI0007C5C57E|nr:SDR family NAD(P)-dependent oxidoreductase [Sphingobium sp. MI1205]